MQNCEEIGLQYCKLLNIPITETTIKEEIIQHPNYPSLLSISDALSTFKVDNMSIKTTTDSFENLPTPFIIQINGVKIQYPLFGIIKSVSSNNTLNWFNPEKKKYENISIEKFNNLFTGYAMLAETSEHSGEMNFEYKRKEERLKKFWDGTIALLIPLMFAVISIVSIVNHGISRSLLPIFFGVVTLVGVITGILLLLYEINHLNPMLQKICSSGHKTNCSAILESRGARIWGLSWSTIGFTYFGGMLITILITGITNQQVLSVAAWLNIMVLPYIIYSIYYQWKIVKQWCPLCLVVQLILILQLTIAITGHFHYSLKEIEYTTLIQFIISFIIVFIFTEITIPALKHSEDGKYYKYELSRLKNNVDVFNTLLSKQKKISTPVEGLGLTLGNPEAPIKLIKVCNPYCNPCAKAHPIIDDLLSNNPNIHLRIIFTASELDGDERKFPAKHLIWIYKNMNTTTLKQALDDWYLNQNKDFLNFKKKYPINSESYENMTDIKTMHDWYKKENIEFTPTFFINGFQLPQQYNASDIKYFLSV